MTENDKKCARNVIAYGIVICMVTAVLPMQVLLGENVGNDPMADNYAIGGYSTPGIGSVLDSPEDGTSAVGAGVRSWVLARSNEIASVSQITGDDPPPGGIFQTTDFVDDSTGTVGRSWVDHGFLIDCAGFPTNFAKVAPFDELIIEIGKNTSDGGYTASCDLVINNDHQVGDLPTNGGFVPLHKIGGVFGTGTPGSDYFAATRVSATSTVLAWPDHPDEWGNIYGYRVLRNSSAEPWHPIFNLTFGNTTTGYTDNTCQPDTEYNYAIAILYRGMQAAVQNNSTVIQSLYNSYAVVSQPLPTVIPTPSDGAMGVSVSAPYSLEFSRAMNTTMGNVSIAPPPITGGAWAWDGTGIWYNYTGAAWADLTKYYLNLTNFISISGEALTGDMQFNFTAGDFTAPTTTVTAPLTANALTFDVDYSYTDPSGVSSVELWMFNGTAWVSMGTENPPTGTFAGVTVPADGTYGWYTAGEDSLSNMEPTPPVGIGFVELWTLVDTVDPYIGNTTADKLFINNQGTHGGTPPPVTVTTNVSDDNLAVAGWGIRNENLVGNGTMYYRTDITYDVMPSNQAWDGKWYFINGILVTADSSPDLFGLDVLVMGEVNGINAAETPLGNILPEHYALFNTATGTLQSIYNTNGTPTYIDDFSVDVGPLGWFRAYRYDEGPGYVATAANVTSPDFPAGSGNLVLDTPQPVPDGRYAVCVTAVDWAQNSAWTNEADGNPVITVDNVAPQVTLTVPADSTTGVALNQDIVITFSETMDNSSVTYSVNPNPGSLAASWNGNNTVMTITHGDFSVLTAYTVQVTAARDPTGNNLIAGAVPNPWIFTAGEFTPPFIVSTNPVNGTTGYSVAAGTYSVQFSEPMDTGITGVLTNLPGAAGAWDGTGMWFNITYNILNEFTVYYVNFTGQGHMDLAGNSLVAPFWFTFLTEDTTSPTVEAGSDETKNGIFFTTDPTQRAVPASASDSGSGITNYTWSQNTGPGFITFGNMWALNTSITADFEGMYTVDLTVTDGSGNSFTDSFMLLWDISPPTSAVDAIAPYWQTASPLTVNATASSWPSNLAAVELWYRFAADNATWGAWTLFGNDTAAPWSWSFTFPDGNGYYEFYTRAYDAAGNYEAAPGTADTVCALDNAAPASSTDAIAPYWQTASPLTVTATASDITDGVTSVELWYRYAADNATWGAWANFGTLTAAPWSWSFAFPGGNGYYQFYTRATDEAGNYEAAPGTPDALCAYDSVNPTSSADAIAPYWQTASPLTLTATATDLTDGVTSVELWYRYAADNATWGIWILFGADNAAPWSWSFGLADGYYEFYTRAYDAAANYEDAPAAADTICACDTAAPASSVDAIASYWQTASPLTVTATASDITDGVASVELWYRYAADNATWGAWILFGADNAAPWAWNFGFIEGYYEFYTRAYDAAANYENAPAAADTICAYDSAAPASSVGAIAPYWQTASPLTVTATASDITDGVAAVELWYRFATDNVTWGPWTYFGNDTAAPWTWSFGFGINGYYEFYTRAIDAAGNYEAAPAAADALCGYDSVLPSSAADGITPYWQTASPAAVTAAASDILSGLASVQLWYRFSADNATWGAWTLFGTDNAAPWSWNFGFPLGNGYYEFYTMAYDTAGNYEDLPLAADTLCGYDNVFPTSYADPTAPYWHSASPLTVTATAIQATADIEAVELWYRFSDDNATWNAWVMFGNDTAAPWSWSFTFPDGDGYYEFYTRAIDLAAKYEAAPGAADAACGYDTLEPMWATDPVSPYWQTVSPLTVTVTSSDSLSGVAFVELHYRFSADNATWGAWILVGTDSVAPYAFAFAFPDGNGYYEFYSNSTDMAGNSGTIAIPAADTACAYDSVAPDSSADGISPYWQNASPLGGAATASDALSGLASVQLWYRFSADNATWGAWTLFGTDNAAPWGWLFGFPDGDGYYEFYTRAHDAAGNYEAAPASADALCAYDSTVPASNVNAIAVYWQTATPLTIAASVNDALSGLADVELWYRFAADNATWGAWTLFGTDNAAPWSWSFGFGNGTGHYQFYTRAYDTAGNYEPAPGTADALCGYDSVAPQSSANGLAPYWRTASPITVSATASDLTSGLAGVELWYRFSADNATWGAWTLFGTDMTAPYAFSFGFPAGDGYYEFYTRAADMAGNYEAAPGARDTLCAFDSTAPVSSADGIAPYWQTASPITVTATASDALSGAAAVQLWYRFAPDNATWGVWTLFGTDNAAPWSWSFGFPSGNGHYQFYTIAVDIAGNYEAAPGARDTLCGYDSILPSSTANAIVPYWSTSSPLAIAASASDSMSGIASVELWYRFSADNATWGAWTLFGTDTVTPWSWSFGFPGGDGYYEFYTRARDAAGNYENAPGARDALAGLDTMAPEIVLTAPADGETDVAFGADIVITFSEPMDTASVTVTVTPNPGGLVYTWSAGNTVLTISHSPFAGSGNYFIHVTQARDPAGNDIAAGSVPNPWSFMTVAAMTVDYIQIVYQSNGTAVGDHVMTIDGWLNITAIGYNALGGAIGPVQVNWTTTGTLDLRTSVLNSIFSFKPATAVRYGTIRATYGLFSVNTGLITVNPGAPVSFNIDQPGTTITADQTITFTASGHDAMGNPTGPVTVTWSLTHATMIPGSASGSINAATGEFSPVLVAVWTVTATHTTLGTATTTVTVNAGALAGIRVSPAYAQADAGEAVAFTAAGFDAKGNSVTLTGGATWFLDGTLQTSGTISSTIAGNHTVFAGHSGFLGIAHLDVSAASGNRLVIGQTVSSITADQTCQFTVTVRDAYGNTVIGALPAISWAAGNGTIATGLFRPWSAGQIRIWANATGYQGGSAFINVTAGSVTRVVISSGGSGTRDTTLTAGQSMLFTVNALDQRDNLVPVPTSTLAWSTTIGTVSNGLYTAVTNLNGAQFLNGLLTVTYTSGTTHITGTEDITVNVGPLHHITIDSTDEVSVNEHQTFTAQGYDLYNNAIAGLSFTWATTGNVGEIGSDGVFRGTDTGMGTVTATSGGISGSIPVFVSSPAGIFTSWLWLAIILAIVVVILVIFLILGRKREVVVIREPEEEEEEPTEMMPDDLPEEFNEPLDDLESELDSMAAPEPLPELEQIPEEGPEITPAEVKSQIAEAMRVERCEKMLTASVVLPDDKEKLQGLIASGISPEKFAVDVQKAIERRKKKEHERDVTADEKAAILEEELVAELAELEGNLENGAKENDLEDEILKEIEDLEDM